MSLKKQLTQDLKEAMKSKAKAKLTLIRAIKSDIKYKEVDTGKELEDNEIIDVIMKMVKSRKDSIEQYQKAGREELAKEEQQEVDLLLNYLPKALTDDELKKVVLAKKEELGFSSIKDMGNLMKAVLVEIAGRADGKRVSGFVKKALL